VLNLVILGVGWEFGNSLSPKFGHSVIRQWQLSQFLKLLINLLLDNRKYYNLYFTKIYFYPSLSNNSEFHPPPASKHFEFHLYPSQTGPGTLKIFEFYLDSFDKNLGEVAPLNIEMSRRPE